MLVSDIIDEVNEITGQCDETVNFRAITRAVELLAAKDLFDPLKGYLDFTIGENMTIALPRDVKAPIRININGNPSFARQTLFEFASNTDGTVDGEEVGWAWADRGRIPINDELPLPAKLSYQNVNPVDDGSVLTAWGLDSDGREIEESLTANSTSPTEGTLTFARITQIRKAVTTGVCKLIADQSDIIAQYYPSETTPSYRVIKLSKKNVSVRMLYRKETYKVSSLLDVLPIDSALAIILAVKAVRYLQTEKWDLAAKAEEQAIKFAAEEQASRNEHVEIGAALEVQSASNRNIDTRDSIIVADIYDLASEIFGAVGRDKVFDRITDAVEALARKAPWNPTLGVVDIVKSENQDEVNKFGSDGNGYYVLPRIVEGVMAITINGSPIMPRNQWHEFHMNGFGESNTSPMNSWNDQHETSIINRLPLDPETKLPIPKQLTAIPELAEDDGTEVKVFGLDENGKRLMTGTEDGIIIPCVSTSSEPSEVLVSRIDRITKGNSAGFIRLWTTTPRSTATGYAGTARTPTQAEEIELFSVPWNSLTNSSGFAISNASFSSEGSYIIQSSREFENVTTYVYRNSNDTLVATEIRNLNITPITDPLHVTNGGESFDYYYPTNFIDEGTFSRIVDVAASEFTINNDTDLLLGYWEPDETEPKYRAIVLPTRNEAMISVLFRRRQIKVTSLYQPLFLRSRLAIENMMRSIKIRPTDPSSADLFEAAATRYLGEEALYANPTFSVSLQVAPAMSPGVNRSIG